MFGKSSVHCFVFARRAVNCINNGQQLEHFNVFQKWFGTIFLQQHNKYSNPDKNFGLLFRNEKLTNDRYADRKKFSLFCTKKVNQLSVEHKIAQVFCRQHNIVKTVHCFCTTAKQAPKTSAAAVNEHWGAYLASRIHNIEASSRFHGYSILRWGLLVIVATLAGVYIFRDQLRDNVADEVADVASRSMADENVILKAHDMTKKVLERLATEADTITLVSEFLAAVLQQTEVKNSAVKFATSVLNHPQTQEKMKEVMRNTLHSILNNQETKELLLEFIKDLIEDSKTRETCNLFMQSLTKDPDIQHLVSEFFKSILSSPTLQMEAVSLGREVTNKVVLDKNIQRQTGDALWSAVKYGVTPYWFRDKK